MSIDLDVIRQRIAELRAVGNHAGTADMLEGLLAVTVAAIAVRDVTCSCRGCRGLSDARYAGECAFFDAESVLGDALDAVSP